MKNVVSVTGMMAKTVKMGSQEGANNKQGRGEQRGWEERSEMKRMSKMTGRL